MSMDYQPQGVIVGEAAAHKDTLDFYMERWKPT